MGSFSIWHWLIVAIVVLAIPFGAYLILRRRVPATAGGPLGHARPAQPIWNPNAAASWSLAFTPAFGSYLHMLNWESLGEVERAANSKKWFYASVVVLALLSVIEMVFPNNETADIGSRLMAAGLLLTWYFGSAKSQAKYVKEKFANDYPRRSWTKPLLFAFGAVIGYVALMVAVEIIVALIRGT